ncbi:MAG: hypothetical protein JW754_04490 [Candidatus Aenigmarchaeota archaeon]|nr:hypothetical protein [Candidatus Aenigmarchaeota archaeon]
MPYVTGEALKKAGVVLYRMGMTTESAKALGMASMTGLNFDSNFQSGLKILGSYNDPEERRIHAEETIKYLEKAREGLNGHENVENLTCYVDSLISLFRKEIR